MIVNELGKFVSQVSYQGLPTDVVEAVKIRVLDVLASGLVGYQLGNHKLVLSILDGTGNATIWGEGMHLSLRHAVLVNSFLAHSTYLEDGSRYAGGHPSSTVIPGAIALGETEHVSGKDLIASVAAGYDVFLRLGRATYPSSVVRGFQPTAVLASVGLAAACANMLHLKPEAAKNALAIACNLGVGLKEALKSSGSQPLQVGHSCDGGLLATMLAKRGGAGADAIIENGFLKAFADNAAVTDLLTGLGTKFRIGETYLKVHGGCRGNHAPIDVVLDVAGKHGIKPEEVEHVLIRVDTVTYAAEIHEPVTGEQAQFSVAYSAAVALQDGHASIFQFTDEKIADPRIRQMMGRIKVEVDTSLDKGYPDKRGSSTEIVLKDGRRFNGNIENAKGEPEYPFTAAEIEKKFLVLTKDILGANAERVRDMVMDLEKLSDVKLLADCLKPAH